MSVLAEYLRGLPLLLEALVPETPGPFSTRFTFIGGERRVETASDDRAFILELTGTATVSDMHGDDYVEIDQPLQLVIRYEGEAASPLELETRMADDRRQILRVLTDEDKRVNNDVTRVRVTGISTARSDEDQRAATLFAISVGVRERY